MKAVILKESYRVAVEDVPVPQIKEERDVLVKVHLAGLCGRFNGPIVTIIGVLFIADKRTRNPLIEI